MNNLTVFKNQGFGEVRTVTINDEPYFVGKDVAEILGYSNSRKALADHVDDEDKAVTKCYTLGGTQDLAVINESGLYALILSSKLPLIYDLLKEDGTYPQMERDQLEGQV